MPKGHPTLDTPPGSRVGAADPATTFGGRPRPVSDDPQCYTSRVATSSVPGAGVPGTPDPGPGSETPTFWLQQQLGFEVRTTPGRAVVTIVCDERHLNPHGTVHGAVVFALVDTGMGAATMTVLAEQSLCATIEIHTRFLAPVFRGALRAEIDVVKAGRRIVHLEAAVTDENDDKVALASGSFAVIPGPPRDGGG